MRSFGMVLAVVLMLVGCLCGDAVAQTARQHSAAMAGSGNLYHAQGVTENVAYMSNAGLFPRLKARVMWLGSPGHRANLPMSRVAVVRDGNGGAYVTGRKLFGR